MPELEVGQTIYVSATGQFYSIQPNLHEYTVVKVNTVSFYAKRNDSKFVRRFNKRTMVSSTGFGENYRAYLNPDEYWSLVKKQEERQTLVKEVQAALPLLSIDTLKEIHALLKKEEPK